LALHGNELAFWMSIDFVNPIRLVCPVSGSLNIHKLLFNLLSGEKSFQSTVNWEI